MRARLLIELARALVIDDDLQQQVIPRKLGIDELFGETPRALGLQKPGASRRGRPAIRVSEP